MSASVHFALDLAVPQVRTTAYEGKLHVTQSVGAEYQGLSGTPDEILEHLDNYTAVVLAGVRQMRLAALGAVLDAQTPPEGDEVPADPPCMADAEVGS